METPHFLLEGRGPSALLINYPTAILALYYRLAYHRTSSTMSTLPAQYGRSSLRVDNRQYGISNTLTDHNLTNNIHGDSNANVGNVSNNYNTINVGVDEGSPLIHAWLSPLEPDRRHRGVSNRRLDDVGNWVLEMREFESWCGSQDGFPDPTLLCYGGQGVGKTFIRYRRILRKR